MISKNWKLLFQLIKLNPQIDNVAVQNEFGLLFIESNQNRTLFLIPLNEQIYLQHNEDSASRLLLKFGRELIQEDDVEYALDVLNLFNLTDQVKLSIPQNLWNDLSPILEALEKEFTREDGSYLIIKTSLKVLLLQLIRHQKNGFIDQDLQQKRIYSFLRLMELHFKTHPEGHYYAGCLGISTKRLNQIVKAKLGLTVNQIINQRRLTEIKRELQNNNRTLKEIAFDYSFNSPVSFSRFFKMNTGITAKDFREQSSHHT